MKVPSIHPTVTGNSKKVMERMSIHKYSQEVRRAKHVSWRQFVTSHGNAEAWVYVYKQQADKLKIKKVLNTLRQDDSFTYTVEEMASCFLDVHVLENRECDDSFEQRLIRKSSRIAPETMLPFSQGKN